MTMAALRRRRRRRCRFPGWFVAGVVATTTTITSVDAAIVAAAAGSAQTVLPGGGGARAGAKPSAAGRKLAIGSSSSRINSASSSEAFECPGEVAFIGDNACDDINNNEYCRYDGGDCCSCTSSTAPNGENAYFNCLDPAAPCFQEATADQDSDSADANDDDGQPDSYYAGDTSAVRHSSSGRAASASDIGSSSSTTAMECREDWMGDGVCDSLLNTADCGYDGGDCCPESDDGDCSECIDPDAPLTSHCSSSSLPSSSVTTSEEGGVGVPSSYATATSPPSPSSALSSASSSGSEAPRSSSSSSRSSSNRNSNSSNSNSNSSNSNSSSSSNSSEESETETPSDDEDIANDGDEQDNSSGSNSSERPTHTKAFVGIGAACVFVSSVAYLGISYSRLADRKDDAAAEAAVRSTGARTAASTPTAGVFFPAVDV